MAVTTDVKAVAAMGLEQVQALIGQATAADVPLRVFFAALDRLTELSSAVGGEGQAAAGHTGIVAPTGILSLFVL